MICHLYDTIVMASKERKRQHSFVKGQVLTNVGNLCESSLFQVGGHSAKNGERKKIIARSAERESGRTSVIIFNKSYLRPMIDCLPKGP